LLLTLLLWETIDRKTKNNTHIDYAIPTEKKAMVRCPPTPLARWTRLVTAPAVALDTTQPIQRSRGVSLNTTTLQPHSLQRYRSTHTFTWSTLCKYDVIHKPEAHNVSQRRQRRTEPRPRTKRMVKIGHVVPEIGYAGYARRQTDRQTQRQTDTLITVLRHHHRGRSN